MWDIWDKCDKHKCTYKPSMKVKEQQSTVHVFYLPRRALSAVQWGSLFGFAEVRVVWVTAPQLLARIKCAELRREKLYNVSHGSV